MEIMVNATVRRYMKEKRPVYVRWKGKWYSGEVVRCGPAYVYKVKSIINRDIYLLERSKLRLLEEDGDGNGDILPPGTDVLYYNQLSTQWDRGVIITHDDCGYAQIRWKMPGMYEEFVNWFDAANVSTTPPNMGHSKKLLKPGLFTTQESLSDNMDDDEDIGNNPSAYRRHSQNAAKPKLFARIRSKQAPPRTSDNIPQEDVTNQVTEDVTVENMDPRSNPIPAKFTGIPPKWLSPTPMYYPCPMYIPVPVLVPHYPLRPPSISYPFFPGQIIEPNFGQVANSRGVPPHRDALQLFRVVPKHQSRLLTRQPFSFSGRKLGKYEPKSLDAERKIEYLPSYESIVHSKFKSTKKAKDKRYTKLASTSDSSDDDELSLYLRRSTSADSSVSRDEMFHPGLDNGGKNRTHASTEFTRSSVMEKKLSDLPSSSPAIKQSDLPTSDQSGKQYSHGTQDYDIMRDEDDGNLTDGQVPITSSDSGVRTAYSMSNQQHGDYSDDDRSSVTITMINSKPSVTAALPAIVVEESHDTSDSEVFTSEIRVNPSHASIEQYLLGSGYSDIEHTLPRDRKSSNDSATELYLNTVASSNSLGHLVDVLDDITTTCRSKRRLMYSTSSEAETKQESTDDSSNKESGLKQKSTEKPDFTAELPTTTDESLPGTPTAQNSHDCGDDDSPPQSPITASNNKVMSSFLKSLSPGRLMSLRPKKKVTFTT